MSTMTVADLIAELQRHPPGKSVRCVLSEINMLDETGDWTERLSASDALGVEDVRDEGGFILLWGGAP